MTVTCSPKADQYLRDTTELLEEGSAVRGFKRTERRAILGGWAFRQSDPTQESKHFGDDYATWEVSSSLADSFVRHHIPQDNLGFVARRVDLACDWTVDDSLVPIQFREHVLPHLSKRGIKPGSAESDGITTQYAGSSTSDRRVRCYRRDHKEDRMQFGQPPTLRIETVVRRDRAEATFGLLWDGGIEAVYGAMLAHLEEQTGIHLLGATDAPRLDPTDDTDVGQMLFHFLNQHSGTIKAFRDAGYDLDDLAEFAFDHSSRATKERHARKAYKLQHADRATVVELVTARIAERSAARSEGVRNQPR